MIVGGSVIYISFLWSGNPFLTFTKSIGFPGVFRVLDPPKTKSPHVHGFLLRGTGRNLLMRPQMPNEKKQLPKRNELKKSQSSRTLSESQQEFPWSEFHVAKKLRIRTLNSPCFCLASSILGMKMDEMQNPFILDIDPPANFLYKMVEHVPHIKPFFYREFLVFFWMLEPVLYHFTFLDLCTSIL